MTIEAFALPWMMCTGFCSLGTKAKRSPMLALALDILLYIVVGQRETVIFGYSLASRNSLVLCIPYCTPRRDHHLGRYTCG